MTYKSYAVWGDERKERSLRKSHDTDWKIEMAEQMDDYENDEDAVVYIIVNSWDSEEGGEYTEIVGGKFFYDEDEAWEHLAVIATAAGQSLDHDATSFDAPPSKHIVAQTYYIEELTHG